MTDFKKIECIEIRLIDGVYFAFYKGEKLPFLIESTIKQTSEGYSTCELKFECKMEGGQHPYEIISEYNRKVDCEEVLSEQKKLTFHLSFDDIVAVFDKKDNRKKGY